MDELSEVSREGWFSRIVGSIKSVLIGLLLFVVSFPLLWWNEGRAVQTAESLDEGAGQVISLSPEQVDAANEGKLVHLSALAQSDDLLKDADFGVEHKGIKLLRSVEMYQWVESKETEKKKKVGGSEETKTTYSYETSWSSSYHDSEEFRKPEGHENPAMQYQDVTRFAQNVAVGAFSLPADMVSRIEGETPLPSEEPDLAKLTPALAGKTQIHDGGFYYRPTATDAQFDLSEPRVGDYRIRFSAIASQDVSLIAQQSGSSFAPFQTKAGDALDMVKTGRHSAADMFTAAEEANSTLTWILRGVGFLLMAIGIGMVFRPLAVIADVIPLFGELLRVGVFFVAIALAAPLSILTIGLAWIAARPLLGGALVAGFVALVVGLVMLARKRRRARATA